MEKTLTIKVEGMTCLGCAEDMEILLRNTPGISDARVAYADDLVTVTFDPEVIDAREAFMKVARLGFRASVVKEGS